MNIWSQAVEQNYYPLKPVPEQMRLISEQKRFKVVPAGRRSGKTERFKRYLAQYAANNPGMYFAGAPTFNQAKKIFWKDLKNLTFSFSHSKKPSESDLQIYLPNGSEIHIIGFDKPARFEGTPWSGGGLDEFGNFKAGAWPENIQPALSTEDPRRPGYKPWCWVFGVPEGLNDYYDLAEYAKSGQDDDWGYYHWPSSEVLSAKAIEDAKRQLSPRQFRQEYEASFETAAGRIYEDYSTDNHTTEAIQPHEQIMWCHDQNYTPLSSAICVRHQIEGKDGRKRDGIFILDEIILTSAVSEQSALEFVERYKDHQNKNILIYGDPAGRAGEKHGQQSAYKAIEAVLTTHNWKFTRKVKNKAPAIKDRQNAVRAKIKNAAGEVSLFVHPTKAPYSHKGLATTQLKEGSSFLEDDRDKYQHITTAIGYMIDYEWSVANQGIKTSKVIGF